VQYKKNIHIFTLNEEKNVKLYQQLIFYLGLFLIIKD